MTLAKIILATVLLGSAALAHALDIKPYSAATLAEAQQAGKPVALHFHADWCPTCKAQAAVLQQLKAEPGLDLTVLVANYDTEKDLKKRFNVRGQSTLVALHGNKETGRLIGETSAAALSATLKSAL